MWIFMCVCHPCERIGYCFSRSVFACVRVTKQYNLVPDKGRWRSNGWKDDRRQCRCKPKWAPLPNYNNWPSNFWRPFLVVTLQNNNRHTSARAQKIFPVRNMRPLSIREVPDRGVRGVFPPALTVGLTPHWPCVIYNLRAQGHVRVMSTPPELIFGDGTHLPFYPWTVCACLLSVRAK